MDALLVRLYALASVTLPLLLFMAWIYLGLHMVFARLIPRADSPVLWFFSVVTGPLTQPMRALLPAATAEPRVRSVSFFAYLGLWLAVVAVRIWLAADDGR